jgi:signal transduction histidine kinase
MKRSNPAKQGVIGAGGNGPTECLLERPACCPEPDGAGPASGTLAWPPSRHLLARIGRLFGRLKTGWALLPLAGLGVFAILFVGWDMVVRWLFPAMSTGLRHGLLTAWAGVVTVITSLVVYLLMRREHRKLSATAELLTRLLGSYQANPGAAARFDNPHLVGCHRVTNCDRTDCPMYETPDDRCWQVMALKRAGGVHAVPQFELERCLECEVYRRSCPDKLTELGESFNNLMFLLKQESKQVGRMRAQMVEKEKMAAIGLISAGIAHEIGNPLSSISSIVQMLKRSGSSTAMNDELDLIGTHIQRITRTVRQLVSLARPSAERWDLVDIRKTLEEAVQLVTFDRRARNVDICFDLPEALPKTCGLRGELQQVFINLSLNALHAMPNGGKLTIRARKRRDHILVQVKDTGDGISSELGRRVFEPFFTTKEPGQGTGLGLAVSYGIVQKHGGEIDFESTIGEGTAFTVEIPILDEPPDG